MQRAHFLLLTVLVAACSAETAAPSQPAPAPAPAEPEPEPEPEPAPAPSFGEETRPAAVACTSDSSAEHLEDHACFHVNEGPFETVASGPATAPGRLARTHVAYTVELTGRETRWVSFRARAASTYAFLFGADAQVDTFTPDGRLVTPSCEGETTGICDGLARKVLVPLAKDATLLLGVTPARGTKVLVLVEDAG